MFPTHSAVLVIASLAETAAAIADHAGLPTSPGSPVRSGWNGRAVPGRSSHGATRLTSPGRWLQVIGVAHAGVGVVLHGDPLAEIVRAKVIGSVPDRGDRATAFWFLTVAPLSWLAGRLLRSAEVAGDLAAQREAGVVLTAVGVAGAAVMPASPFWSLIAVGLASVRGSRGRRPRS
ncbi:DUF6463 family protein [Modestobacter sp. I12A-02662]|uniref:DUF6463 family protein n=1 Tax=Modestobacter sp. I12A-02662 TaxID=1730496 RepID=UPI0034DEADFA